MPFICNIFVVHRSTESHEHFPIWAPCEPEDLQHTTPYNRQYEPQSHHLSSSYSRTGFYHNIHLTLRFYKCSNLKFFCSCCWFSRPLLLQDRQKLPHQASCPHSLPLRAQQWPRLQWLKEVLDPFSFFFFFFFSFPSTKFT